MTLGTWLLDAECRLTEAGIEEPRAEARLLAVHALGKSKAWVLVHADADISEGMLASWLERRLQREPLAYITGVREFYGRAFRVTPDTLVPRPDTETVVQLALQFAPRDANVLDVGTGSGCIGITLALERPDLRVTLSDVSSGALRVARENAESLGADVEIVESDLYAAFPVPKMGFWLIVSNPPYIREGEPLMDEVGRHEPPTALFAGADGLDFYRRLAKETPNYLYDDGALVVEIGYDQAETVPALFQAHGWRLVSLQKDLSGITRAIAFRYRP